MSQIRLARGPQLAFVLLGRENIRTPNQVKVVARMVLFDFRENVFKANHEFPIIWPIKDKGPSGCRLKALQGNFRSYLLLFAFRGLCFGSRLVAGRESFLEVDVCFIEVTLGFRGILGSCSLISEKEVFVGQRVLIVRILLERLIDEY